MRTNIPPDPEEGIESDEVEDVGVVDGPDATEIEESVRQRRESQQVALMWFVALVEFLRSEQLVFNYIDVVVNLRRAIQSFNGGFWRQLVRTPNEFFWIFRGQEDSGWSLGIVRGDRRGGLLWDPIWDPIFNLLLKSFQY